MLHWGEAGYQSDKSCLKCPPLTQKFEGTNPWEWTFEALPNEHLGPMDFLVHASILLMERIRRKITSWYGNHPIIYDGFQKKSGGKLVGFLKHQRCINTYIQSTHTAWNNFKLIDLIVSFLLGWAFGFWIKLQTPSLNHHTFLQYAHPFTLDRLHLHAWLLQEISGTSATRLQQ